MFSRDETGLFRVYEWSLLLFLLLLLERFVGILDASSPFIFRNSGVDQLPDLVILLIVEACPCLNSYLYLYLYFFQQVPCYLDEFRSANLKTILDADLIFFLEMLLKINRRYNRKTQTYIW